MTGPRVELCGTAIDNCTLEEAVRAIIDRACAGFDPGYVVTPNAQHLVLLKKDSRFRQVYRNAFLAVPDGVSLLWAARLMGSALKERVNGTDLFERTCAAAAQKGLRVFLLGGRPGAADRAAQVLRRRHPALRITGTLCPPYGFENDPAELSRVGVAVKTAAPDILFVGLGAPKQEYWICDHGLKLGVPVSVAIGGSFEMVGNVLPRAPAWLRRIGMEWSFRLLMEPRRLWRRYLLGNFAFVLLVLKQRVRAPGK